LPDPALPTLPSADAELDVLRWRGWLSMMDVIEPVCDYRAMQSCQVNILFSTARPMFQTVAGFTFI
jgi:hypothetical protein